MRRRIFKSGAAAHEAGAQAPSRSNGSRRSASHWPQKAGLYFAWYNFCRVQMTIKTTPAGEQGLTDHV